MPAIDDIVKIEQTAQSGTPGTKIIMAGLSKRLRLREQKYATGRVVQSRTNITQSKHTTRAPMRETTSQREWNLRGGPRCEQRRDISRFSFRRVFVIYLDDVMQGHQILNGKMKHTRRYIAQPRENYVRNNSYNTQTENNARNRNANRETGQCGSSNSENPNSKNDGMGRRIYMEKARI